MLTGLDLTTDASPLHASHLCLSSSSDRLIFFHFLSLSSFVLFSLFQRLQDMILKTIYI